MSPFVFDRALLEGGARHVGIELGSKQLDAFARYGVMLSEWNQHTNLTRIPEEQYVDRHFIDSLRPAPAIRAGGIERVIDIGTGAGFPGLPLRIAFPDLQVTLVDSVDKKLRFLRAVREELGLDGLDIVHARAEDLGRDEKFRERFDLVTARALADLRLLAELGMPLAKVGGLAIFLKGPEADEELAAARNAFGAVGGKVIKIVKDARVSNVTSLIYIAKEHATRDMYPRSSKKIYSKPL